MPTPPPKPPAPKPGVVKPPPGAAAKPSHVAKTFSVKVWTGADEGEKILMGGGSGMGKTTLGSMMPRPTFIGIDDGGRKIRDPRNGNPVNVVAGIETFQDVRDALHQKSLFDDCESIVIDTATRLEVLSEGWILANVKTEKGAIAKNIEAYGWGKGYRHVLDTMRLIQQDLDPLIRKGKNILLLCQESAITVANAEGLDYLQDGPKLLHNKQVSVRNDYCEWADHVLRIGYYDNTVQGSEDAKVGKIKGDTTRVVYATGARHFFAKSRTLREPVISFSEPADDSLWQLMFPPKQ